VEILPSHLLEDVVQCLLGLDDGVCLQAVVQGGGATTAALVDHLDVDVQEVAQVDQVAGSHG
ncbi:hypothetical protein, partial [Escherichia coli]|uniref:hypothetical protein n=1 Tax=Escherichia coli TaxID=562 RepID=UPI001953D80C